MFAFHRDLDPRMPAVPVNEFIIWEILEPLIQNSIDHGAQNSVMITLATRFDPEANVSTVRIQDTGVGIPAVLLERDARGVRRIFEEKKLAGTTSGLHSGYGCQIAYQMAVGKCGWGLDAENLPEGGCCFTITIHHGARR